MSWRSATYAIWAALGLCALVLILLAAAGRGRIVRRPIAPVRAYLSDHRVVRVAALIGWMWLGWHSFAR